MNFFIENKFWCLKTNKFILKNIHFGQKFTLKWTTAAVIFKLWIWNILTPQWPSDFRRTVCTLIYYNLKFQNTYFILSDMKFGFHFLFKFDCNSIVHRRTQHRTTQGYKSHKTFDRINIWYKIMYFFSIFSSKKLGVRISSTFSVLRPFSYLRPFLYFDLFCTST